MLHRVDSPICPPKKQQSSSITLWLLIIVDQAWKTNQAEFFRSTCLPYKILPKTSVRVNQPFILFIHHIWGETVLWGAVFIIQISDKMQYFKIFQEKLHSFNIHKHRSTRWLLAKPFKKISKITYTASLFSLLTSATFAVNIKRVTLQHKKEFILFIFYLMVL